MRRSGSFGKSVSAFDDLINEEDISIVRTAYKNATENNRPFESIIRTRDNNGSKYLNIRAYIRKNADGIAVRFTGVCYDVTPLKETENTILKLNEDLIRSNRDLESFAYVASHDLQEPLRMVSSFMQLLSMKYEKQLDKDAHEYIGFAVEGAKRMYDLLNGLLTYSRVTSRGAEFTKVDMNKVLESVMKNLKLIINEKKAVIKPDDLPVILADENQMVQLLQNLITNAIKFSQKPPEIFLKAEIKDQNFVFSVRDNGPGIEEQYFEKIFRIFQRLVPRDNIDGIGIGLSICKRIVERHKGSIWVESKPGQGASFFFTIPNHF
jgi:light-regulated signal transduction histidine kinase (bacteriophytochrome)